jgi:hypothetical protein
MEKDALDSSALMVAFRKNRVRMRKEEEMICCSRATVGFKSG